MTQKDNILQELNELNSSLANLVSKNIYTVPVGYFEELADQVLGRIKATEATNATDELVHLSPLLSKLSKKMPYSVPQGYFEGLEESLISSVQVSGQSAREELEKLSPLLSSLNKEMPYSVPQGYFENLAIKPVTEKNKAGIKVIPIGSRKWIRFAAAAIITGIILTAGFFFINQDKVDPNADSHTWVKKSIKKVSTDKLDEFIELTEEEKSVQGTIASVEKTQDIKELIKDIPENEIQSLLNDTELLDDPNTDEASDDIMMN